jgi:alanine racemase
MNESYRCWAEIDLGALRHNVKVVRDRLGSAEMLAVVKANAYGHGMVGVAEALAKDAQLFGVANLEEAITLRAALPHPIIILGPAIPQERSTIAERGFIPSVSTLEEAEDFNRLAGVGPHLNPLPQGEEDAKRQGEGEAATVEINFKVDTGMGRMGVPEVEAVALFKTVAALSKIKIHSISTHMPVSNEDADYTRDELSRFQKIVKQFRAEVPGDYKAHVLQSAGLFAFSDPTFEIVRAGIMLYGISPLPDFQKVLQPVMTWKTRIALVRDMPKGSSISYGRTFITPRKMSVATLSAGYADGYSRHLSNRDAAVLVRGKRCALLGRVTMDLIMIDVSGIENVEPGEEVVLMGRQGDEEITAVELAERAETISWEIITRVGTRVRRVFV